MCQDLLDSQNFGLAEKSADARKGIATRAARAIAAGDSVDDRAAAVLLAGQLVRDAAVMVRDAFARGVAESEFLPPDLARAIARDVPEIAAPFIRATPVLSDADFERLIGELGPESLVAVAERPRVSASLALALTRTEVADVLRSLVANDGADLSASWPELLDGPGSDRSVVEGLARRDALPAEVVLALFERVGEAMRAELAARHGAPDFIAPIAVSACNTGFARALAACDTATAIDIVADIDSAGRLTPLVVLEIVRAGRLPVIEAMVARRLDAPLAEIRRTLRFGDRTAAVLMLEAAGVPRPLSGRAWDALAAARARLRVGGDTAAGSTA